MPRGEVLPSKVPQPLTQSWYSHSTQSKMTLNLVVPIGKVRISLIKEDINHNNKLIKYEEILSQDPYFRLTIPPGIWFAFEGLGNGQNLVCNIANFLHDPDEVKRKDINFFKI